MAVDRLYRDLLTDYPTEDQLFVYLRSQSYTGSMNDMIKAYLVAQGYTGGIDDAYWRNVAGVTAPTEVTIPGTVPSPLIWYNARNVTTTGSDIDSFVDQGSAGVDATDRNPSLKASLTTMGGQTAALISPDGASNGGYAFTVQNVKTIMMRATYGDGTDATFTDFDSLIEGGTAKFVGNNATATTFNAQPSNAILDGVAVGNSPTVLPMNNRTVGLVSATALSVSIFGNQGASFPTRVWRGTVGDIIMWTEELTAPQILAMHNEFEAFYNG